MNGKTRRQAEILDASLQRIQDGKATLEDSLLTHPDAAPELQDLLITANRIHEELAPHNLSPKFIKTSAARLQRRIRALQLKNAPRETVRAFPFRLVWNRATVLVSIAAAAVLLVSGWGVSSASAQALPGDALYSVKRGLEEISLAFSPSAAGDVELLAKFVDIRLEEIQELIRKGRDTDLITGLKEYTKTLSRLNSAIEQLPPDFDPSQLEDIQVRLTQHTNILLNLRDQVPQPAQEGLDQAVEQSQKSNDLIEQATQSKSPDGLPSGQEKTSTKNPEGGSTNPESTKTPEATKTPKDTKTPEATKTPKDTKTPEATKTPKDTKTPAATKTAEATKTPEDTKTAEATKTPKTAKTPEVVATPERPATLVVTKFPIATIG
jgi:hypothetical protein